MTVRKLQRYYTVQTRQQKRIRYMYLVMRRSHRYIGVPENVFRFTDRFDQIQHPRKFVPQLRVKLVSRMAFIALWVLFCQQRSFCFPPQPIIRRPAGS